MSDIYISVTGHRPPKLGGYSPRAQAELYAFVRQALPDVVARFPGREPIFITGMALGFDQAVAQACVDLGYRFLAALPFAEQSNRWPKPSHDHWASLLRHAWNRHTVGSLAEHDAATLMQMRNVWMVDRAEAVLALWDGSSGGTGNCVRYAREQRRPILHLWKRWQSRASSQLSLPLA